LSIDHKPDHIEEKKRILESNGRVQPFINEYNIECGPSRVWIKEDDIPGLAMSRSIGDYLVKNFGVIADPGIYIFIIIIITQMYLFMK